MYHLILERMMAIYQMKYSFDWGSRILLWSTNEAAEIKFGYAVDVSQLPISHKLKDLLWYLVAYYDTMLDMDNAPAISPWWTDEDKLMFNKKQKFAYAQLCQELGKEYEIIYAAENCI